MARINPHKKSGFRIDFYVYYKDGTCRRRSRYSKKKTRANEIFRDAERLETLTRGRVLVEDDADYYFNIGLLAEDDVLALTGAKPSTELTWERLGGLWKDYYKKRSRPKTFESYSTRLPLILDILGGQDVSDVDIAALERFRDRRLAGWTTTSGREIKGVSPATVNRDFQIIRPMLDIAVKEGALRSNPAREVKDLAEKRSRLPRVIHKDELDKLFATLKQLKGLCHGGITDMVLVGLYTGMRMGEILYLPKANVQLPRAQIYVQAHGKGEEYWRPKTAESVRAIDINPELIPTLERRLETEGPYLFSWKTGGKWGPIVHPNSLTHAFDKVVKKAELSSDLGFHCLRHSFVTYLLEAGAPIKYVQQQAGHADIETTMKYLHLLPSATPHVTKLPSFAKQHAEAEP